MAALLRAVILVSLKHSITGTTQCISQAEGKEGTEPDLVNAFFSCIAPAMEMIINDGRSTNT